MGRKMRWLSTFKTLISILLLISAHISFAEEVTCNDQDCVCIVPGGERVINDILVYRDCWKKRCKKVCKQQSDNLCDNWSEENRSKCIEVEQVCSRKDNIGGIEMCVADQKNYSCEKKIAYEEEEYQLENDKTQQKALLCHNFCMDGECDYLKGIKSTNGENDELSAAIGQLQSLAKIKEGVEDLNNLKFNVFSGTERTCSKKVTGYINCCRIKGWGANIGLTKCDEDARSLAKMREKKQCAYVEEKCTSKFLGVCVIRKEKYCCFGSVLAKSMNIGGKAQVGRNIGNFDNPDCRGISYDELQRIDFNKIDYQEFLSAELLPKMKRLDLPTLNAAGGMASSSAQDIDRFKDNHSGYNPKYHGSN